MRDADAARAWAKSLCRALPPERRPQDLAALEAAVVAAWQRATERFPSISIAPLDWFEYVGQRLHVGDPAAELERRNLADLYLAFGCACGDPAALQLLEHEVMPAIVQKLTSQRMSADQRADLMQSLRERMLVAVDGQRGIAAYDGRAPLAMWLRVAAAQMGQRQIGRDRRAVSLADGRLDEIAPGLPDPALLYLKRHYGAQFRSAFADAVRSLDKRERNLLRHAVIDELGIDQIAAIYHIHRVTAARQLKQARVALVNATRIRMRAALKVSETELESILRGVMSMADVTLRNVLAKGRGFAAEPE